MPLEFILTGKGKPYLKYKEYIYRLSKQRLDETVREYECPGRCGARLVLMKQSGNWKIKSEDRAEHCHAPQTSLETEQKFRNECKLKVAADPNRATTQTFEQVRVAMSPALSPIDKKRLPGYNNVRTTMTWAKRVCLMDVLLVLMIRSSIYTYK